jgi:trehalose synthase
MKPFINEYDRTIISSSIYKHPSLRIPQTIIPPSIDPLSAKNMDLNAQTIQKYLNDYGILRDKPIVTQVSRFDPWKDPEGIRIYEHMEIIA